MFTLNEYFGYMIKATLDADFNGNFFMESTHYRGQYIQYYPSFMKALAGHLKNDFALIEMIALMTPSWQEAVQTLKENRENVYKASEMICEKVEVSKSVKNSIDEKLIYNHARLFVGLYIESVKDHTLVGKSALYNTTTKKEKK